MDRRDPEIDIFEGHESNVRSYCRSFPAVFTRAKGAILQSETGQSYIDFFSGAGALNYGHNHELIKHKVIAYLMEDNIIHAMDMFTSAKRDFLVSFADRILRPRKLSYKVQFCGPTGTNAVEAALKLARKATGRTGIFSFMGAYHGVSLGALATTAAPANRKAAGQGLPNVSFIPYPTGCVRGLDTIAYMQHVLEDPNSGIEKPAAIILETVQAEGGVNVAPVEWLRDLRKLCDQHDILMICDDIQVGCGRTGTFFSFERAGIEPDIVVLSKSISGSGAPMSLLLIKPHLDLWEPGEHNGTFRGYQPALVGATAALAFWSQPEFTDHLEIASDYLHSFLVRDICNEYDGIEIRGLGMIWGIDLSKMAKAKMAKEVSRRCFELGLIVETVGRFDSVLKLIPPLTVELEVLGKGCSILKRALGECLASSMPALTMHSSN